MKDSKKKKMILYLLLCLIGLAGLGVFYALVLAPQKIQLQALQKQVDQEEQKRQDLRLAGLPTSREKRVRQLEVLDDTRKELVGDFTDSSGMTFTVNEIARDRNLKNFTSMTMKYGSGSDLEKCEYLAEQRIRVSFSADFIDFIKFLNTLERNRPVIFVDRFTALQDDGNPSEVKVDMELACFSPKKNSEKTP